MFKHILVPLDGSLLAEAALPAARFLADKLRAMVTLLHVIEKNPPKEVHGQPHLSSSGQSKEYLRGIRRNIFADNDRVKCHVHETAVNDVAASIVSHHSEFDHDLIVMCSHGRGRALHLILGSIAQKVIALGPIPVLITHPDEKQNPRPFTCDAILVPLDGEKEHEIALPFSAGLTRACGATLHLVHVVPDFNSLSGPKTVTSRFLPGTTTKILEIAAQDGAEYLREKQDWLNKQGITSSVHVLRGDPADVIAAIPAQSPIDLIALATHGKSGMEAFWAGSVAHKVCSQSKTPLLLVPAAKTEPSAPG
ncbi:MAG: universal stress protein [Proteobacteria bacterium]|nr:universal stress protein [Pseudomonadota bacterium]MBU0965127.1 universal stress protein [Pseudomonadota bacterium]